MNLNNYTMKIITIALLTALLLSGCSSKKDKDKFCVDMATYLNKSLNYSTRLYTLDTTPNYTTLASAFDSLRVLVSSKETVEGWSVSDSIKSKLLTSIYSDVEYISLMKVFDDGKVIKPRNDSRLNIVVKQLDKSSKQKGEINDLIIKATAELK